MPEMKLITEKQCHVESCPQDKCNDFTNCVECERAFQLAADQKVLESKEKEWQQAIKRLDDIAKDCAKEFCEAQEEFEAERKKWAEGCRLSASASARIDVITDLSKQVDALIAERKRIAEWLEKWRTDGRSNNVGRLLDFIASLKGEADGK